MAVWMWEPLKIDTHPYRPWLVGNVSEGLLCRTAWIQCRECVVYAAKWRTCSTPLTLQDQDDSVVTTWGISTAFICVLVVFCFCLVFFLHQLHHTYTHPFNSCFSGTTRVSRYQKGKTNLDFTEARDSEWQWHQLGHMQVTSLQTDNHASDPHLSFFTGRMPFPPHNQQGQSTEGIVVRMRQFATYDSRTWRSLCVLCMLGSGNVCMERLYIHICKVWWVLDNYYTAVKDLKKTDLQNYGHKFGMFFSTPCIRPFKSVPQLNINLKKNKFRTQENF